MRWFHIIKTARCDLFVCRSNSVGSPSREFSYLRKCHQREMCVLSVLMIGTVSQTDIDIPLFIVSFKPYHYFNHQYSTSFGSTSFLPSHNRLHPKILYAIRIIIFYLFLIHANPLMRIINFANHIFKNDINLQASEFFFLLISSHSR